MRRVFVAIAVLLSACAREPRSRSFVLATTTSIQGSGVLTLLQTALERDTGIEIHPLVAGSGKALKLAAKHEADVTITHDPEAERAFVAGGGAALYQPFMWNDFVIVGPANDPAGIAGATSAAEAFARIARARSRFTSRNDQSGTHTKERSLWKAAGVVAESNPEYLKMGQPMAHLLRSSSEMQAYTLSDRATFEQLAGGLQLRLLFSGDPMLRNVYAVILVKAAGNREAATNAQQFVAWLLRGRGRTLLERYEIKGRRAFHMM